MPNAQSLSIMLICILCACGCMALGSFAGSKMSPGKLGIFSGVLAMIVITIYAAFSAIYFLSKGG